MRSSQNNIKTSIKKTARAFFGLLFALITAASPWWLTEEPFSPVTEQITLLSASLLSSFEREEESGQSAELAVQEVIVEPTTTTVPPTTTTTATTTAAPATTTTTAAPEPEPEEKNLRPVREIRVGGGTQSCGIYVRNGTGYDISIPDALEEDADCRILCDAGYQVLIIHTHTTECYARTDSDSYDTGYSPRTTDKSQNMAAVGEVVAQQLEAQGIRTLHVTTIHDYPEYNGSYDRALETIKDYLEKYPSIEMVIDIHRDSITADDGTKTKPTVEINGRKAAQIMIITGCDNNGKLYFPNWQKNLRMAAQLQRQLTQDWEGLMRPLYFAPFRYNMHMTPNSLLVEFGTDVNTLDEALYSAELFGQSLANLLLEYEV